jgi:Cu+-exporting ATPase
MEKDPVCGMMVDPKTAEYKSTYHEKTYYFCSPGCKKDFEKDPERYTHPASQSSEHMHHH